MNTTTTFENLISAKIAEINTRHNSNIVDLQAAKSTDELLNNWQVNTYLTRAAKSKKWDLPALVEYLTARILKAAEKKVLSEVGKINDILKADRQINSISVSVEWKKSKTWGANPTADIRVCFADDTAACYASGPVSGCGYDKESTAIANALNQCPELLHALYSLKDNDISKPNRDLLGYGSGYGLLPYFEGGVGVSCYPAIFETIGLEWKGIAHGKTFDVYEITRK